MMPARTAFWETGRPVADRGSRRPVDCPGADAGGGIGGSGRRLGAGPVARAVPDPAHRTSRNGRQPARSGRRWTATAAIAGPARGQPRSMARSPPRGLPPRERDFHMMVRDGDTGSPSNYAAVRGVLKGVGHRVQVYVAAEDIGASSGDVDRRPHSSRSTIASIRSWLDRVGTACDVDGDGRFTILLSSWLDHLGGGRYPVDGFVRVADLDAAYRPPFGNRCDMMYLNSSLKAGPSSPHGRCS